MPTNDSHLIPQLISMLMLTGAIFALPSGSLELKKPSGEKAKRLKKNLTNPVDAESTLILYKVTIIW